MRTHTPGPWRCEFHPFEIAIECVSPSESMTVALINGRPHSPEIKGNARLIAAAPDLLAALYELSNAANAMQDTGGPPKEAKLRRLSGALSNATTALDKAEDG